MTTKRVTRPTANLLNSLLLLRSASGPELPTRPMSSSRQPAMRGNGAADPTEPQQKKRLIPPVGADANQRGRPHPV